jgi:hypothetical protein
MLAVTVTVPACFVVTVNEFCGGLAEVFTGTEVGLAGSTAAPP